MAEEIRGQATKYAVVTGANKGIGFEICRQLASQGVVVVLTARNETRGVEAVEKLKGLIGLAKENVVFQQLDVMDPSTIASLAEFIKIQFGRIDILVNNAGIGGVTADADALRPKQESTGVSSLDLNKVAGALHNPNDNLEKEKIQEVIEQYLRDNKENTLQAKGWPSLMSAYILSKAAMNTYSRVMAKKYPSIQINCICPGFVKTDMTYNSGILSIEQGAESPVMLALQPDAGPSGFFFVRKKVSSSL
ncbi:(+)-neomenthol dehydrogenase-like [Nicotiana tabacum]|uniref:(+)-neomenthol dehydrogenase-like n=1 Tax=Nicotiana tabacum TaxID=4097 RepID=A0AC58RQ33_TOBAC